MKKTGKLYGLILNITKEFNVYKSFNFASLKNALEYVGISHQILDDNADYNNKDVFLTNEAFLLERNFNFFNLGIYGYSKPYLEKYHRQLGEKALNILKMQLNENEFLHKEAILELCCYVAFGNPTFLEYNHQPAEVVL